MPNNMLSNATLIDNIEREQQVGGVDSSIPETFVNAVTEAFKSAIVSVNTQIAQYYNRSILELAVRDDLTEKAAEFGVTRQDATFLVDSSSSNFNVFIQNGKARDFALDPDYPIVIPKQNISVSDVDGNIYIVGQNIVIEPDAFSGFAPIISTSLRAKSIAPNELINLSIVINDSIINLDPTKAASIVFGSTNIKAISNSRVASSDDDIRRRSFLRINSMNNVNDDAIRLALTNIGIDDITFIKDYFGFGTTGVMVRSAGSTNISDTTISLLNDVLSNVVPHTRIIVPETLRVKLVLDTEFINTSIVEETKVNILNTLSGYFADLNSGDPFDPEQVMSALQNIDNIKTVKLRCIFIDERKVLMRRQFALIDQIFQLDEQAPVSYTA